MVNWKEIHEAFTEELQKQWEDFSFDWKQVQEWIEKGSLEPTDAGFALFLKENGYIPETVDDILDDLREEYWIVIKEVDFFFNFEERNKKPEVVTLDEKNWKNINPNFTLELVQKWQELDFNYEEVQEWINAGIKVTDANFCAWLRDEIKMDALEILNNSYQETELREQFQEYHRI